MSIRASLVSFYLRRTLKKQMATFEDPDSMREQAKNPGARLPKEAAFEPVTAGGVSGEWVRWPGSLEGAVLLYLHGGGYVFGGPDSHRDLAWRFAKEAGIDVLVLDYRLAPEHRFPAALEDATAAYRWLLEQGFASEQILVAGDSAGGGLAAALMVNLKTTGMPQPLASVLISPWVDLAMTGESMRSNVKTDAMLSPEAISKFAALYLGDTDARSPGASPMFSDLSGLPPTYVIVGGGEVLLSDSQTLVKNMRAAGGQAELKVWPGMPHVFPLLAAFVPEGRSAIVEMAEFIRSRLGTVQT